MLRTGHTGHVPVMVEEVVKFLQPGAGGNYVDGTLGGGGHTQAILERSAPDGRVLGIDADAQAIARVGERLADFVNTGRLVLVQGNFVELARIVEGASFISIQGVVLDLGFSSEQMGDAQRGFSFSVDGPLDMRFDQSQGESAADIVNSASEQELADIFWRYGEETRSRRIAQRIVKARARGAITRTGQLAQLAAVGAPYKPGAIHPATRTFQALRIAVNRELEHLEEVLPQVLDVLSRGKGRVADGQEGSGRQERGSGRMVIITFHSLEDRLVKEFMRREARDCLCPPQVPICVCGHKARLRVLTPKPVTPTVTEVSANPRARSAKLRAAEIVVGS
jgi:16S rRNA (cytosine1402-N4)-methyltransferase